MIKRFDLVNGYMPEDKDGYYVLHQDYQAMLDAKDAKILELEKRCQLFENEVRVLRQDVKDLEAFGYERAIRDHG